MLFAARGELLLSKGQGTWNIALADELDQLLLQQVKVEGRVGIEYLCERVRASVSARDRGQAQRFGGGLVVAHC